MKALTIGTRKLLKARRPLGGAVFAIVLFVVTATPTQAAFPGENGLIAYASDGRPALANDDIYVTDENGADHLRLTTDAALDRAPAVSPNGKEIAFYSTRDTVDFPNPGGDSEIYVMDANDDDGDGTGDNLRRLTDNAAADRTPAWSPDGKKLAFRSDRDGNGEIYVMDADGSEQTNLTNDPALDQLPVFSPHGSQIAFTRTLPVNNTELFMMNVDGTEQTNLTNSPRPDAWPEFSPDGKQLAFGSVRAGSDAEHSTDIDIWVMSADGSGTATNLTDALLTNERWPAWSPDGHKIAFWSGLFNGLGADAEIYSVTADGSGTLVNLTHNQAGEAEPDWGRAPATKTN